MQSSLCKKLTFNDCELAILRQAIDKAEERQGRRIMSSPEVKHITHTIEKYIRGKKLLCYGGMAVNNILPEEAQFYNRETTTPDYDCYSATPIEDAKQVVDIFVRLGYEEVEAKSGQHFGTFKVYVDFIPILDLTYLPLELINALKKNAIIVRGIYYSPPNWLRMNMYIELSRPEGHISRWEKVLKRLILLNKYYPLEGKHCDKLKFQPQRPVDSLENLSNRLQIYDIVLNSLIDKGVVFFGGYALTLYAEYMPANIRQKFKKNPDFDVLSEKPLQTAKYVKEQLTKQGITNIKVIKRPPVDKVLPLHYEVRVNNDSVCFIYEPLACHSYNKIERGKKEVKIATIDTMLNFYLVFLYVNRSYYDKDRVLCMAEFLFYVQQKNRLAQKGLLKRFSLQCIGHQVSVAEQRALKTKKFKELKNKKNTREYEEWFLHYRPQDVKKLQTRKNRSSPHSKTQRNKK